ncbi:MAG: hypothetical protein K6E21_06055 [Bacilli bacterium]|nr:hypothetical protein [Bacilli bacterium]
MKLKKHLFVIPLITICTACSNRDYEAFGDLNKEQVKNICESYSERVYGSKKEASFVSIDRNLGNFKNNTVFVNILEYKKDGVDFNDAEVDIYLISETLPKTYYNKYTYICSLADYSYGFDVYVEQKGSFTVQEAYDNSYLTDEDIAVLTNNFKYTLSV